MRKAQKKFSKQKFIILFALFVFLFSIFKVGITVASTNSLLITNVEISSKTSTTEINNFYYENYTLQSSIVFHNVGDSVTYKISLKNNDKNSYTIASISDDNKNSCISYEYEDCEGIKLNSNEEATFYITEKYTGENMDISERNQAFSVNIFITLVDENGEVTQETIPINKSSSPKTGDSIDIYVTMAIMALVVMLVVSKRKCCTCSSKHHGNHMKTYSTIILGFIIIPTVSKAIANQKISITIENIVSMQDKLIFSYEIDGVESEKVVKYNEKVEGIENPNKKGCTFVGWRKSNGEFINIDSPVTEDTMVEAVFECINYNINYNLNGGSVESENPTTYTVEDKITLNNPNKVGYTFSGWTGSNGNELQTRVTINEGSTGDKTYNANYSPNLDTKYTVIHKIMKLDGKTYETKDTEILHGATDTQVKPQTNVYTGFKAPEQKLITIAGDGNTTLEYKYQREQYKLTLVNEADIETTTPTGNYFYEKEITLKAKDKTGYTFKKWSTGETTKTVTKTIMGALTIEAIYDADSYNISFDSKGGSAVDGIVKKYNEEIGTLPVPTKDNKVFEGWYEDEEYTTKISPTTKVTGEKTYYAKWRDLESYVINFESNGGSEVVSITVQEGSALGTLQNPEKEDYKFRGWYTDNTYTTRVDENTIPTSSTTYYAKWVDKMAIVFSIENAVTFNGNSESIADGEVPAQYLGSDGKYVDSHVALFSEANYSKDFEIGFNIDSYDPNNQDEASKTQFTFVNTKDEDGSTSTRPGFVFRTFESDKTKLQLAVAANSSSNTIFNDCSTVKSVKIYRKSGKIYYSINGGEKNLVNVNLANYTGRFNTTATFGASVQRNGTVYRHLNATLSNMYIKLEIDD